MAVPKKKRSKRRNKQRYSLTSKISFKNYKKGYVLANTNIILLGVEAFVLASLNPKI